MYSDWIDNSMKTPFFMHLHKMLSYFICLNFLFKFLNKINTLGIDELYTFLIIGLDERFFKSMYFTCIV